MNEREKKKVFIRLKSDMVDKINALMWKSAPGNLIPIYLYHWDNVPIYCVYEF